MSAHECSRAKSSRYGLNSTKKTITHSAYGKREKSRISWDSHVHIECEHIAHYNFMASLFIPCEENSLLPLLQPFPFPRCMVSETQRERKKQSIPCNNSMQRWHTTISRSREHPIKRKVLKTRGENDQFLGEMAYDDALTFGMSHRQSHLHLIEGPTKQRTS